MLHIIILNKGFFPEKLTAKASSKDRVVVISSADGSIPVSAFSNEVFRGMEVKLIPEIKNTDSEEGRNMVRLAQAMLIGQLTASENEYEIYTDDTDLINALSPFTGNKPQLRKAAKKTAEKKASVKTDEVSEAASDVKENRGKAKNGKNRPMVSSEVIHSEKPSSVESVEKSDEREENKPEKKEKTPKNTDKKASAKLPTLARVKKVLGAANSAYAKLIYDTIKKSNQITFEMNVRMELAKAGLDAGACQELAKTLNDEFVKTLPVA